MIIAGAVMATGVAGSIAGAPAQEPAGHTTPELRIVTRADRAEVRYPREQRVTFTVTLATGARSLDFQLFLSTSHYRARRAGAVMPEGATMTPEFHPIGLPIDVTGQATVKYFGLAQGLPACSPVQNRFHGGESGGPSVAMSMAENATSTVTATYIVGNFAPWPGDDPQLTVTASPLPGGPSTLTREMTAHSPKIAVHGKTGTRIGLATTPPSYVSGTKRHRHAKRGTAIEVRGTTDPPLRAGTISLSQVLPGAHRPTPLAHVRTDRRGAFTYEWTPKRRGIYELWAFSPAGPDRVRDYTCPIAIDMT
jgi:hypothetical protein